MASRSTLKAAEELKANWKTQYPGRKFRIIDNSTVTAEITQFDVVEVRHCQCGAEILTIAIGEAGLDECKSCAAKRRARQKSEMEARIEKSKQSLADWQAMDEWEE